MATILASADGRFSAKGSRPVSRLAVDPALLEQRVARAHRMGQKRPVQVYLMITENTIEENLLATLSAKHEPAAAVLDPDSELREVQLASGIEDLKRRLEASLGARREGPPDVFLQQRTEAAAPRTDEISRRPQLSGCSGVISSSEGK